jgi:hypothetical protein
MAGAGLVTACKDSPVKPVEKQNEAPVADFTHSCLALRCEFHDNSSDDGEIISWNWSFGVEGSSQRNPIYNYPAAGSQAITLKVTDDQGVSNSITKTVLTTEPLRTALSCTVPNAPGEFVACTIKLEAEAVIQVTLNGSSCEAHGDVFRVILPEEATLTEDGCYERGGKTITLSRAYPSGTIINAEVIAPLLKNAPRLIVGDDYPVWHLTFEDGADTDFNDLDITVTAIPTGR